MTFPTRQPMTPPLDALRPGRAAMGPFPKCAKLSLVELGTHVEIGLVLKHVHCGERAMVAALLRHLTPEMLLLLDQGFFSYELWQQLNATGVKLLATWSRA